MTRLWARGVSRSVRGLALCVVVLVVASLAAAVEPARACSCIPPDPWSYLRKADGAFVGHLVSRREVDQGRAVLTFDVERAVKGKIGTTVEVTTANNGAACGIETSVGRRIGLFLMREGDGWVGHLCWQVEPADLLAAAALPAPNGKGPAMLFVGGQFGPARTLALDAKGRTLAYGMGNGEAVNFSVCPGGQRVAEVVEFAGMRGGDLVVTGYVIAIRELPTLRLLRRQRLKRGYYDGDIRCADESGKKIALFSSDTGAHGRLRLVTPRTVTTLWRGTAFYASTTERFAYIQVLGPAREKLVAVDLRSRLMRSLGTVPVHGAYQLVPNPAAPDSRAPRLRRDAAGPLVLIFSSSI